MPIRKYLAREIRTEIGIFAPGLPVMVYPGDPARVDLGPARVVLPPSWLSDRWRREMRCSECHQPALHSSRGLCRACLEVGVLRGLQA